MSQINTLCSTSIGSAREGGVRQSSGLMRQVSSFLVVQGVGPGGGDEVSRVSGFRRQLLGCGESQGYGLG